MSYLNKSILISLILFLGLGLGLTAIAQDTAVVSEEAIQDETVEPADLETKEPKLLPDNPLYFLKEWGRGIQSFFAFGQLKKTELAQKFANEKLLELKKLVEGGKIDSKILEKATEKYEKSMDKIKEKAEKIKENAEKNEDVNKFLDKFTKQQLLHEKILQKLENQVPADVLEKIKQAREKHLEKFGEVMTKLENREEKIKEKLEKNLQEQEGSKFKNFKNLEVLLELENKIPEQAKKAIRQAQENALNRLKGDLEKMSPEDQEKFKEYLEQISGDKETQLQILEKVKAKIQNKLQLKENLNEVKENLLERLKIRQGEQEKPDIGACITLWDPVCGKDRKTYSNSCFAQKSGVKVSYKGKCEEFTCDTLDKRIIQLEKNANYCNTDSDCIVTEEGALCWSLTNKNADLTKISNLIEIYSNSPCPIPSCMELPKQEEIKCKNNKCVKYVAPLIKTEIPETKEECERQNGVWGRIGLNLKEQCNLRTSDAGKICTGPGQCEGSCVADFLREETPPTSGKCSPYKITVGCRWWFYVENSPAAICAD